MIFLKKYWKAIVLSAMVLIALIFVPFFFSGYKLKVINISMIYSLLVLGMSIMLGMGGQMSFAPIGFMGLGAYVVANFCSGKQGFTIPSIPSLMIAVISVALIGFLIGLLLLRLKGMFFTFATIAFTQVAYSFFSQYRPLFGGPDGIMGISELQAGNFVFDSPEKWFYLMVALVVIAALLVERVRKTKFGRSLACIRDNSTAALTLGVNTYMTSVYAFTWQAAISALAGGLYALVSGYVGADMFSYNRATLVVIMVMLGGINSTIGCIAGAFVVNVLPELLRSANQYLNLSFGLLVILFMIFMPDGIAGAIKMLGKRGRQKVQVKKESKEVSQS